MFLCTFSVYIRKYSTYLMFEFILSILVNRRHVPVLMYETHLQLFLSSSNLFLIEVKLLFKNS